MRFELIVLIIVIILPWRWDQPIDLYPSAPPLIQVRGKPATNPSAGIYRNISTTISNLM
jgi:hypothetical protein